MEQTEPGDDELMARIAAGDEGALRAIVGRWERPVLAFLARMLGSIDDAQELGSETFWRVWKNAAAYRPSGQFKSWLFRIAGGSGEVDGPGEGELPRCVVAAPFRRAVARARGAG